MKAGSSRLCQLPTPRLQVEARPRPAQRDVGPEGSGIHLEATAGQRIRNAGRQAGQGPGLVAESQPQNARPGAPREAPVPARLEGEGCLPGDHASHRVDDRSRPFRGQLGEEVKGDVGGGGVDPAHAADPLPEPLDAGGERALSGRADGNGQEGSQDSVTAGGWLIEASLPALRATLECATGASARAVESGRRLWSGSWPDPRRPRPTG